MENPKPPAKPDQKPTADPTSPSVPKGKEPFDISDPVDVERPVEEGDANAQPT